MAVIKHKLICCVVHDILQYANLNFYEKFWNVWTDFGLAGLLMSIIEKQRKSYQIMSIGPFKVNCA